MVTLIFLGIEFLFFGLMSALFEYHWRNDDFDSKTTLIVRLWYYVVSALCLTVMTFAL